MGEAFGVVVHRLEKTGNHHVNQNRGTILIEIQGKFKCVHEENIGKSEKSGENLVV